MTADTPDRPTPDAGETAFGAHRFLPTDEHARHTLAQRAKLLAGSEDDKSRELAQNEWFLRFHTGGEERYGLPFHCLEEILYVTGLRAIPGAPRHIVGVVNRRGALLTVMDLNPLFGNPSQEIHPEGRIIVTHAGDLTVGLLAREVEDEEHGSSEEILPTFPSSAVENLGAIRGIYQGRVTLLNPDALLRDPQILVNDAE
ncbi:chemotaxis protein CheW [Magnetofaba australis]|uniref:Putative CheW protein n=1 Tax=Magnetofaba australis IT-1 TaxID=1434232 RepID=A0A1Y2K090_9PROT|nr:chemotaxis protein CheW [Magnetofaba australis]OSM00214.1 putative CheW protein [Magnetofaba australis IT-1]